MKDNNGRRAEAGPYQQNLFQSAQGHAAALIIWHVQNVVSQERHVGGFALHYFAQRDGDLVLAAVAFAAVYIGFFGGKGHEALGEGQHLENGGLRAIPHGKGAGQFDVAYHINLPAFRYADLLASAQDDVQGGIGSINKAFDQYALDQGGSGSVWAGLGAGDQDFGAGFRREAPRSRDGFEQGDRAGGLEGDGLPDGARHRDGVAVVFGNGYRNEGIHNNLLVLQSFGNRGLELSRHQALRLDPLFEHRKADETVGAHAHRAGQCRRVVYRDSDQVVGADRLGGKIRPLSLRRGDRGSCLAGRDGQETRDADEDQDQQQGFTIRRCFWHCSLLPKQIAGEAWWLLVRPCFAASS